MNDLVLGEIKILGWIHGGTALNTLVTLYATPDEWEMKQFVSQLQAENFARENALVIRPMEKSE